MSVALLEVKTGLSRLYLVNVKESVGWLALSLLYSSTKASTTTTLSDRSTIRQSLKLCKKYLYTYTRIKCIKSDSDSKQSGNLSQNKFTLRTATDKAVSKLSPVIMTHFTNRHMSTLKFIYSIPGLLVIF